MDFLRNGYLLQLLEGALCYFSSPEKLSSLGTKVCNAGPDKLGLQQQQQQNQN